MSTFIKGYGKRIAAIRTASGLGKQSFAREVLSEGASARNISRIENEEVIPRDTTIRKLCEYGGVSADWLTQGKCVLQPRDIVRARGIGERIAAARKKAGLSALGLSRAAGLGDTSKNIQRLEIGEHNPTYATVEKIARVLRMTPTELAFGVAG